MPTMEYRPRTSPPVTDSSMKDIGAASASFSIRLTGVSRSAASRIVTN